jgi:hypothetical protein
MKSQHTLIDLQVTEYRADGTTETNTVWISCDEAVALDNALENAHTLKDQIALLVEHQVLPQDASLDAIAEGIEKQAAILDIVPADFWLPPISVMFFSQVSATFRFGTWTRVGMTPFMDLLDKLLGLDFSKGFDFYDFCWGVRGNVYTYGPLGEHSFNLEPGLIMMGGFIGYTIEGRLLRHSFYGAAVITGVIGLGNHDFDPWFP